MRDHPKKKKKTCGGAFSIRIGTASAGVDDPAFASVIWSSPRHTVPAHEKKEYHGLLVGSSRALKAEQARKEKEEEKGGEMTNGRNSKDRRMMNF